MKGFFEEYFLKFLDSWLNSENCLKPYHRIICLFTRFWITCRVWTSASAFPRRASISSRERIQGSQTSIMWGINHLAPNRSTYSLIPHPSVGVVLLLRVAQTHLLVCVGRWPTCKEGKLENLGLGDENWVRDNAKPNGAERRGFYPSAGSGGFSTMFAGENNNIKTQSLSLWLINQNSPVYPWDRRGALGGTSTCAPLLCSEGRARRGKIRPELCAGAWPFVSAVSLLVTDGDAVLVNLLPSQWHAICLHPDSERRDSSCPSSNWQQGAVFTFDRAKKH